jgi:plastocyanin
MQRRRPSRRWAVVGVALLLLGGVYVGTLNRSTTSSDVVDAAGSSSVAVTGTSSFSFMPNAFNDVAPNTTVTVTFTDGSSIAHTFSVLNREGVVIPNSPSTDLAALFQTYGALVNLNVSGAGDVTTGTFASPGTGWYEFVCLEAGHFAQGMYGFIAFGEVLPGNLSVSSPNMGPGAAVFIIIGTIVALTVIAIVLGFVVGRRRGSSDEMPPERLGYPEPPAPPAPPEAPLPPGPPPAR